MPFPEEMAQIQDETWDPGSVTVFSSFAGNCYSFGAVFLCVFPLLNQKIAS